MNPLTLQRTNDQLVRVLDPQGECVGNLKLIGQVWKFKALGRDADGQVIPGGGPLTGRHNLVFAALDETAVSAALLGGDGLSTNGDLAATDPGPSPE